MEVLRNKLFTSVFAVAVFIALVFISLTIWGQPSQLPAVMIARVAANKQGIATFVKADGSTIQIPKQPEYETNQQPIYVVASPDYKRFAFIKDGREDEFYIGDLVIATRGGTKEIFSFAHILKAFPDSRAAEGVTKINVVSWTSEGIVLAYRKGAYLVGVSIIDPETLEFRDTFDLVLMEKSLPQGLPSDSIVHASGRFVLLSTYPAFVDDKVRAKLIKEQTKVGMYVFDLKEKKSLFIADWSFSEDTKIPDVAWDSSDLNAAVYSVNGHKQTKRIDLKQWKVLTD